MRKNNSIILGITTLCFLTGIISHASATESKCTLENGPDKSITDYIKRVNTSLDTLTKEGKPCGNSATDNLSQLGSEVTKIFNRETNFKNFTSSTNFWIQSAINSTMPNEFIRDHQLLQKQTDKIQRAMDVIYKRCENESSKTKIGNILADNINMVQVFELSVLRDGDGVGDIKFVYIEDGKTKSENTQTASDIRTLYSSDTKEDCINSSKSSQSTAELSQKISTLGKSFSESLKDWKRGWSLLTGVASDYSAVEKRLLKKELGKQGLSTEQSSAILNRLDQVNGSNGMSDYLKSISQRAQTTSDSFIGIFDKVYTDLYNAYTTPNTHVYGTKLKQLGKTEEILSASPQTTGNNNPDSGSSMIQDYEVAKALIYQDNVELQTGVAHLKMVHEMVNATIGDIKANQAKASAICKSQAQNAGGNCDCRQ